MTKTVKITASIFALGIFFLPLKTSAQTWKAIGGSSSGGSGVCTVIGQPCGGGIFAGYTTDESQSGLYYLIVAPSSLSEGAVLWSATDGDIPGAESFKDGVLNTDAIIAEDGTDTAAGKCRALTTGGFTDWYLPATDEFTVLFNNKDDIGVLASGNHWASTQNSSVTVRAFIRNPLTNNSTTAGKVSVAYSVHCARRIEYTP